VDEVNDGFARALRFPIENPKEALHQAHFEDVKGTRNKGQNKRRQGNHPYVLLTSMECALVARPIGQARRKNPTHIDKVRTHKIHSLGSHRAICDISKLDKYLLCDVRSFHSRPSKAGNVPSSNSPKYISGRAQIFALHILWHPVVIFFIAMGQTVTANLMAISDQGSNIAIQLVDNSPVKKKGTLNSLIAK
jgi:hypothetical protein